MTEHDELWTITELAEQAAAALGARVSEPSDSTRGRARDLPDPRTIRWYQTTGLIDRPATLRGRTALYGRRHLAQLVAIKRLQADGRALATIQADLAGAADDELERLADLPPSGAPAPSRIGTPVPTSTDSPAVRPRFWTAAPPVSPAPSAQVASPADRVARAAHATRTTHAEAADTRVDDGHPAAVAGIRLADGVLLVLDRADRAPNRTDLQAATAAAKPLLAALRSARLAPEPLTYRDDEESR